MPPTPRFATRVINEEEFMSQFGTTFSQVRQSLIAQGQHFHPTIAEVRYPKMKAVRAIFHEDASGEKHGIVWGRYQPNGQRATRNGQSFLAACFGGDVFYSLDKMQHFDGVKLDFSFKGEIPFLDMSLRVSKNNTPRARTMVKLAQSDQALVNRNEMRGGWLDTYFGDKALSIFRSAMMMVTDSQALRGTSIDENTKTHLLEANAFRRRSSEEIRKGGEELVVARRLAAEAQGEASLNYESVGLWHAMAFSAEKRAGHLLIAASEYVSRGSGDMALRLLNSVDKAAGKAIEGYEKSGDKIGPARVESLINQRNQLEITLKAKS